MPEIPSQEMPQDGGPPVPPRELLTPEQRAAREEIRAMLGREWLGEAVAAANRLILAARGAGETLRAVWRDSGAEEGPEMPPHISDSVGRVAMAPAWALAEKVSARLASRVPLPEPQKCRDGILDHCLAARGEITEEGILGSLWRLFPRGVAASVNGGARRDLYRGYEPPIEIVRDGGEPVCRIRPRLAGRPGGPRRLVWWEPPRLASAIGLITAIARRAEGGERAEPCGSADLSRCPTMARLCDPRCRVAPFRQWCGVRFTEHVTGWRLAPPPGPRGEPSVDLRLTAVAAAALEADMAEHRDRDAVPLPALRGMARAEEAEPEPGPAR